jgi:hypothetical protein
MKYVSQLLETQREAEREFVREAAVEQAYSSGWTSAQLMFHLGRWRERLRDGLTQLQNGREVTMPPDDIDGINEAELAEGRGLTLEEAAPRSDAAAGELIDLCTALGDRPFKWYRADTTAEAAIRNGYFHPRNHIAEHFIERGDRPRGAQIFEATVAGPRRAEAPGHTLGPALLNLASARVVEGRRDEALRLLAEAVPMRAELRAIAAEDPDLAALKDDPRFSAIVTD